jgi:hypothetical protein
MGEAIAIGAVALAALAMGAVALERVMRGWETRAEILAQDDAALLRARALAYADASWDTTAEIRAIVAPDRQLIDTTVSRGRHAAPDQAGDVW